MLVRPDGIETTSIPRNCYQVAPLVWAGAYIGLPSKDNALSQITWLSQMGVRRIINLTSHDDQLPAYTDVLAEYAPHITHEQYPIIDGSVPSEVQMVAILRSIDDAIARGEGVYIHCWGGFGRTGMVVACWYKRQEQTGTAALKRLQQARYGIKSNRPSPDYSVQVGFVMRWQEPESDSALAWLQWRRRFRGALLGGAVGDAMGVTNEMRDRVNTIPLTQLVGGGISDVAPGGWTDDTAMVLCVAESLMIKHGFDAHDQMDRFVRWWRYGYMTCAGRTYDVGNTTRLALFAYIQTGDPFSGVQSSHSAGNGALARVGPIGLYYAAQPDVIDQAAMYSSMLTHATAHSIDACRYVAWIMAQFVSGVTKHDALHAPWPYSPLCEEVALIAAGSYRQRTLDQLNASSYVIDMLEIVMWTLYTYDDFASGLCALSNAGGLTTTSCSIYGALAGALYGDESIPLAWRQSLAHHDKVEWFAEELLRVSWPTIKPTLSAPVHES
jgi:ADP-ribosyl-[dinitrogen reductase] hydrolase